MGDDPLSPVCGTLGSESLLGLYPVPVRDSILNTPLVWYMNGNVVFSVGSSPHKGSVIRKSARRRACALLSVHGAALDIKIKIIY
jgi:hypothetical protein